jgi:general secretion pathway protein G
VANLVRGVRRKGKGERGKEKGVKINNAQSFSFGNLKNQRKIMQYKHQGFTLLEMLVVLVIIGLLAGLVGPQIFGNVDKAKLETANVQVKQLKTALQTLRLDMGRLPTTDEGLALLSNPPKDENLKPFWKGPYLEEAIPLDPWHRPYQYSIPGSEGREFALYSLGADGQPGGTEYNADVGYLPPR